MKTKFKFAAKFIAVFLTLLLVFEIIPMQVVAESADKIKTVTESNEKSKKKMHKILEIKCLTKTTM